MRYDKRPAKVTLTPDDEARVRGIGVVIPPRPTRNLKDIRAPRHAREDRSILIIRADGTKRRLGRTMEVQRKNVTVVKEPPRMNHKRYAGAEYGETWQTSHSNHTDAKTEREYWFRGVKYESQAAIEAFINSL
jgi:hypothetical protein